MVYSERLKFIIFSTYLILAFLAALFVANTSPGLAFTVAIGVVVFIVSFVSTEAALYILLFSMLLSPEFGARGTTGGGATLRIDDFLIMIIGISWLARMAVYKELGLIFKTKLNRPIFYYILVCFISTAFGVLAGRISMLTGFFFVVKYIEYFVIYFMVTHYISDRKQIRNFVITLFITCAIVSVIAIIQIPSGERITAPFEGKSGEPNTFGGYLILMLAIVMGLLLYIKETKRRVLLAVLGTLIFIPFVFTLSRSSWIAFFPMYVALIFTTQQRWKLLGILIVVLALAPFLLPESARKRINYTFQSEKVVKWQQQIGDVTLDTSTSARIHDWKLALAAFLKKPILGYGITGWKFVDSQYIRTLVELGILGVVTFIGLIYALLKEIWRIYRIMDTSFAKGLTLGLFVGTIALITHSIGANTFIIVRIMEPFWFITGLVMILPFVEEKNNKSETNQNEIIGAQIQ